MLDPQAKSPPAPAAAIILAAGKSTRMRSKLPKPLHPLCGFPMTSHVIRSCREAGIERIVVIVGHEAEAVKAGLGVEVEYALQEQQRGTGDAVSAARPLLEGMQGTILVLAGDVPLLSPESVRSLLEHQRTSGAAAVLLTAFLEDPTGYGRVIRDSSGRVTRIVEQKDASIEERAVKEWNPSLYAFRAEVLWSSLAEIRPNNAQGEFYLTDTIGILAGRGEQIEAISADNADEVMGVNNRVELAAAAAVLRQRVLVKLMLSGVTVTDPANTYVDADVEVGQDTVIEPNTFLLRGTRIGEDCTIGPYARIENSAIGSGVRVLASQVADSVLEDGVKVGPFSQLRPGSYLGPKTRVGNFVEIKNSRLGVKVSASHLSYIGDTDIGDQTNIGAGTITCNYDGFRKSRTVIGSHAFIGSHSTLVAPVTIGDGAFVAAGSVIPRDVPEHALAIARSFPTIKENWAKQWREKHAADSVRREKGSN